MAVTIVDRDTKIIHPQSEYVIATLSAVQDAIGAELDFSFYQSCSIQISGTFTGTVAFEVSNDGITWVAKQLANMATSAIVTSSTAAGIFSGDIGARFLRVRMNALTAGAPTITIIGMMASQYNAIATQAVSGTITANLPTGTTSNLVTVAGINATIVKNTAGSLFEVAVTNPTESPVWLKFYQKTTAPVPTTDPPIMIIPVPAGGFVTQQFGEIGKRFTSGIVFAVTGAAGVADATPAPAGVRIHSTFI